MTAPGSALFANSPEDPMLRKRLDKAMDCSDETHAATLVWRFSGRDRESETETKDRRPMA